MKRISIILLIIVLSLALVSGGAFAKGKPSWANSQDKQKGTVVEQQSEDEESTGDQTEPEGTANQAKNRGQAKKLEERIKVRGMNLKFDIPPVIKEGRTLIPVRAIMNGLGADVQWDPETKTVTITRDGKEITLNLATGEATVDGEPITLDVPAQLISNRTFVPLRFVAQTLGEKVDYDEETGEIDIGEDEGTTEEGTTDEGTNNEGTTDEGSTDEGSTDEGTNNEGTTDEGSTDEGSTDEGTNDEGTTDDGSTDEGSTDEGSTDEGTTDDGTTDEGTTEQ